VTVGLDAAPVVPWGDLDERLAARWRQGEHVSLIGPTGCGKTTLALNLLDRRTYVATIGTKPRDRVLGRLRRAGWPVVDQLPTGFDLRRHPRVLVWPRYDSLADRPRQRQVIRQALADAFAQGGWALFADEAHYLARELRLADELRQLWQMGREMNVTVIAASQRPAHVPLDMFAAPTHVFVWRTGSDVDLRRLGELGTFDPKLARSIVRRLGRHEFLYLDAGRGEMLRSQLPGGST